MTPVGRFLRVSTRRRNMCNYTINSPLSSIISPTNPFPTDSTYNKHAFQTFELYFFGTGYYNSRERASSATALSIGSELMIFGVGDGTTRQIRFSEYTSKHVTKVFISKLTASDLFGLPSLINDARFHSSIDRESVPPLELYGPPGLYNFIVNTFSAINFRTLPNVHIYELCFTPEDVKLLPKDKFPWAQTQGKTPPIKSELASNITYKTLYPDSSGYWKVCDNEEYSVVGGIVGDYSYQPCFGFVVKERDIAGNLNVEKCEQLEIPREHLATLKSGKDIVINGKKIKAKTLLSNPTKGRKISIVQSGFSAEYLFEAAFDSDVLVHNCLYSSGKSERAQSVGASTPKLAGMFAQICQAKRLVLTHFDVKFPPSRTKGKKAIELLINETETVFTPPEHLVAVEDFSKISIPVGGFQPMHDKKPFATSLNMVVVVKRDMKKYHPQPPPPHPLEPHQLQQAAAAREQWLLFQQQHGPSSSRPRNIATTTTTTTTTPVEVVATPPPVTKPVKKAAAAVPSQKDSL